MSTKKQPSKSASCSSLAPTASTPSGVTQNRPTRMRPGTLISAEACSLRRYEQRLERSEKQQVIALGRLGWPLRRNEQETGVRRETVGAYLKAAGIGVRTPGAWGRRLPAKPANENQVTTGSDTARPTHTINPNPKNLSNKEKANPANAHVVTTGFGVESTGVEVVNPERLRSASASELFREAIELGLSRGPDATAIWQDLVPKMGSTAAIRRSSVRCAGCVETSHCSHAR
jgi:hypothetical protein